MILVFNNRSFHCPFPLLLLILFSFGAALHIPASAEIRVIPKRSETAPHCIALIRPAQTTEGKSPILLRLVSETGRELIIRPVRSGNLAALDLVVGDLRVPMSDVRVTTEAALSRASIWKALTETNRFHLTARFRDGSYKSSRFDGLDGERVLQDMAKTCGFALPNGKDIEIDDWADLSQSDLRLALWALARLQGAPQPIQSISSEISDINRTRLRLFQKSAGLPQTGALDRASFEAVIRTGGIAFRPIYDGAVPFSPSGGAVKIGEDWYLIDRDGNRLVKSGFGEVQPIQDSGFVVRSGQRWIAIDRRNRRVPRFLFDTIRDCAEDWCTYRQNGRFGYAALSGMRQIPAIFDTVLPFRNGFAFAKGIDGWFAISDDGRMVPLSFAPATPVGYQDRRFIFLDRTESQVTLTDRDGAEIAKVDYRNVSMAGSGLLLVEKSSKIGYIQSRDGALRIDLEFQDAGNFASGIAPAKKNGLWGYIDRSGRWVISPKYRTALPISQGLAVVEDQAGRFGIFTASGDIIAEPQFEEIKPFSEDLAAFRLGDRWGYFDRRTLLKTRFQ